MSEASDKYLPVRGRVVLHLDDVEMEAMRASGAGGQNVNKVSTAIHLRFDLHKAHLPERVRERMLGARDKRITDDGVLMIKAQRFRTQAKNRQDALDRLVEILAAAAVEPRRRVPTRPTRGSKERRLKKKDINSKNKVLRKTPNVD